MPKKVLFYLAALTDLSSEKFLPVQQTFIIQVKTSLLNDINNVAECKLSKLADYTKVNSQLICWRGGMPSRGTLTDLRSRAWEPHTVQYEQSLWEGGIESSPAGDLGMKN